uniref:Peroxisomal 2,4-dienoyl-CoA reductase [(3E)-enoyl-CoA-producing] n=1 Tax=Canis lupus familiaris TaxID=9615 RepID=A0A8C0YT10_CANLF
MDPSPVFSRPPLFIENGSHWMRFGDSSIAGESHFPSWRLVRVASLSRAWPAVLRVILRIRWGCLAGVATTVTVRLSVSGSEARQTPWPQHGPYLSFTPASEGEAQGTQQGPCSCRAVHLRLPAVSLLSTWCLGAEPYLCVAGVPHARETQTGAPRVGTFGATRLCSGPCVFCKLCLRPWAGASAQESLGEEELCLEHQAGTRDLVCPLCLAALTPALWLRRHGCHTVIASRSFPRVSKAARKLAAATGQRCLPLSLDVRAFPAITAAVDQALKEFGKIDILVNCAAGNFLCPASALSFNAFKTVMDIDSLGTFNMSRVLYEKFFRDHGGVIVNITATLGTRGQVLQVHAGSAKAAVDAMTRHLAVEWGPQNIRINSLAPGPISGTEGFRRLGGHQASVSTKVLDIPLQRLGNKTEHRNQRRAWSGSGAASTCAPHGSISTCSAARPARMSAGGTLAFWSSLGG